MLDAFLFLVLFIISIPGVWIIVYRRAIGAGVGKLMSHMRGLVFSTMAFGVLFVVLAIATSTLSPPATSDDAATAQNTAAGSGKAVGEREDTSDAAYAKLARMYQDRHLDDLEAELVEGHVAALKVIPAHGAKSNVADVLTARGIRIARNADVACLPLVKLANAPGCMITVYLTRKNSDQQTDLSGVPAHWFMGVDEKRVRPLDGWAQHVDQNDRWLDASGALGNADSR